MARKERPLEGGDGPLLEFATALRALRHRAGSPPYRDLSARAHYSVATLSGAAAGRRLPSLDVTLSYVRACGGDLDAWERRWHAVALELAADPARNAAPGGPGGPGEAGGAGPPESPDAGGWPYVGLAAFRPEDADLFFGRERLVEDLLAALDRHRVVALVGASGAGKSSLLHAGLLPRLRAGAPDGAVRVLTPGRDPLARLQRALAEEEPDRGGVLIVDQFEEVFTLCPDPAERARSVAVLIGAARRPDSRLRVVLGVRADFYAHCTRHPELVAVLREAQVVVGPMTAAELRRAVVEPARRAGLTVEGALQATLVAHAHGQVGALPLLSHALLETWRRRRGAALTLDGFHAAGGFEGALAQSAEALHASLTPRGQRLARQVFVHLIALGEGTEDTKRPVARGELGADADTATVLDRAAGLRLLTLDQGRVELTHEALIRAWPRLRGWLTDDRERLRAHRRLAEATRAWEGVGRDPGSLLRGTRLALARELEDHAGLDHAILDLAPAEREFLAASAAAEAAAGDSARRRTRRLRCLVGALAALVVVAAVATGNAVRAEDEVTRQRNDAVAQNLAETAAELGNTQPALAVQLGLTAYRLSPTARTRDSLLSTLMTSTPAQDKEVVALAYRPDGRQLATAGGDHTARIWRTAGAARPTAVATLAGHGDALRAVAYRPDGRILATGCADGTVRLWDVADPARPAVAAELPAGDGDVRALAFSPDGRTLATGGAGGFVRLWDTTDPARPPADAARLTGHRDTVRALAFSPDGRTLATGGEDATVRLWEVADRARPVPTAVITGHDTAVFSVAFSPDGRTLATASGGHTPVRLWDLADPHHPATLATLTGPTDVVGSVAFSPDGRALAGASDDRTVRLWTVARGARPAPLAILTGHLTAVGAVAFSPDGAVLASGGYDTTLRLAATDLAGALAGACAHTGPTITRAQWASYMPYLDYAPPCAGLERP
ncbi:XRE family transcriptional regulator [Streptomyces sp. NPDC088097]|uniref:nSTAND1 domain-containing NTPase n=1 Tax=Streptomyces sp. NPDC088097 TaxID=3365823 RepID=UPI0038187FB5